MSLNYSGKLRDVNRIMELRVLRKVSMLGYVQKILLVGGDQYTEVLADI